MADIAVVDDEEIMRDLISTSLERLGHRVQTYRNAIELIDTWGNHKYHLVISDFKMPGMTGLELAEKLLGKDQSLPFVLMTAYGTIETAVRAMKIGVQDFIEKPFQLEMLEHTVAQVLQISSLKQENRFLKENLARRYKYVGEGPAVKSLLELINEVAGSNSTVLVTGESGTGKELVAQNIHQRSKRAALPLVKINCAAIPESLIESELFGHEKGSYTGAIRTKPGKFELANGGTLLLDEIGEMPLYAQSKLLRVLQEREVTKVGGTEEIPIDVRIICVTNRNLLEEVEKGEFREDLYYRLNVIPIQVPALREHLEDLEHLSNHFIHKYNQENGYSVPGISIEAMDCLKSHSWPGNIRELENVMQRAVVFAKNKEITSEHMHLSPIHAKTSKLESETKALTTTITDSEQLRTGTTIAEAERQLILKTLEACANNRTRAAEMLDISIRTLRNKLNEYKME